MLKLYSKATFVWRNISSNTQLMKARRFGLKRKAMEGEIPVIARDDKETAIKSLCEKFKEYSLNHLPGTKFPGIVDNLPRIDSFKELEKFGIKTNQRDILVGNAFEKAALALAKENYKEGFTIESVEQKIHEWNDAEKARDKMIEITAEKLEYFGRLMTSSFVKHHGLIFLCDGVPRLSECPERFQGEQRKELHTLNSTVFCILGQKCAELYDVHPLEVDYFKQIVQCKELDEKKGILTFVGISHNNAAYNMSHITHVLVQMNNYNGDNCIR